MGDIAQGWLFVFFAVLFGGGWTLNTWLKDYLRHRRLIKRAEQLAMLKEQLVERGMSADDIERIVKAGLPEEKDEDEPADYAEIADRTRRKNSAIHAMIENKVDAAGIELVIQLMKEVGEDSNSVTRWMAKHGYSGEDIARVVRAVEQKNDWLADELINPKPAPEPKKPEPAPATLNSNRPDEPLKLSADPEFDLEMRSKQTPVKI